MLFLPCRLFFLELKTFYSLLVFLGLKTTQIMSTCRLLTLGEPPDQVLIERKLKHNFDFSKDFAN